LKIAIASDHAGFNRKETVRKYLLELGHEVKDFGTFSDERTDYPRWIRPAAEAVARGDFDRGIVLGGSGNGEAIVANKVRGIRCGYCFDENTAYLTRLHNDANCIAIGERIVDDETARRIVKTFLETEFEGGRHIPRIQSIEP
jgi:ribose 5-phosphate isomerase B